MDKTRVDDMLIEMITPKVKEIEEKFTKGQGLTQEDINTLLLKSQYNHINHLDNKLNEVTADVATLKVEFDSKFSGLKSDFDVKFNGLSGEFNLLEKKFENRFSKLEYDVKLEIQDLKIYIEKTMASFMRWFIGGAGVLIVILKLIDKIFS